MIFKNVIPLMINFLPIQQGTGNATPTNVRPIVAPLNLTGIGEIYGGIFDTQYRTVTETWGKRLFQDFTGKSYNAGPPASIEIGQWIIGKSWEKANGVSNVMSDIFYVSELVNDEYSMRGYSNTYPVRIFDSTFETKDDLATKYAGHYLVYELRFPTVYNLTPEQYTEAISQLT